MGSVRCASSVSAANSGSSSARPSSTGQAATCPGASLRSTYVQLSSMVQQL